MERLSSNFEMLAQRQDERLKIREKREILSDLTSEVPHFLTSFPSASPRFLIVYLTFSRDVAVFCKAGMLMLPLRLSVSLLSTCMLH